jgi:addiction module HigA family antidote
LIKDFKCKKTGCLFKGERVREFSGFARQADKRLRILDASDTLEALKALPGNRISQIIRGLRDVSADTALRLGQFFGTGPELWINLQKAYDLDKARSVLGAKIRQIARWDSSRTKMQKRAVGK